MKSRSAARCIAFSVFLILIGACSSGSSTNPTSDGVASNESESDSPESPAGNTLDTDGDGAPDSSDIDDDDDGFLDVDDPAPLDSNNPGDFSTPEAILSDPTVEQALTEAADQGFSVAALVGTSPPNIEGYYLEVENATTFVASDNGDSVGGTRSGAEFRYDQSTSNTIDGAVVNFDQSEPTSYSLSFNALLRGAEDRFTRYSRSRVTCTVDGSDFSVLFVGISTASIDQASRDFVDRDRISVSVGVSGDSTESCDRLIAGGAERVGGWSISRSARIFRAEPAEFQYMCVDDDEAYAPTETWVSSDDESCSCTENYETDCQ